MDGMSNKQSGVAELKNPGIVVEIVRAGAWLPAEELQKTLAANVLEDAAVNLDMGGVDHLDAGPFQVLLAFVAQRQDQDRTVRLLNISAALEKWFGHVGAASLVGLAQV